MSIIRIATFATRALQTLFGAVILGLSATAINWQKYSKSPAAHGYGAFAGALALLLGLIGLVTCLLAKFDKPVLIADAVAAAVLFAGGITYAVQLKGVNCKDKYSDATRSNSLIDAGMKQHWQHRDPDYKGVALPGLLKRCKMVEADAAFLFLGFLTAAAAVVLGLLVIRKTGKSYGGASGV